MAPPLPKFIVVIAPSDAEICVKESGSHRLDAIRELSEGQPIALMRKRRRHCLMQQSDAIRIAPVPVMKRAINLMRSSLSAIDTIRLMGSASPTPGRKDYHKSDGILRK